MSSDSRQGSSHRKHAGYARRKANRPHEATEDSNILAGRDRKPQMVRTTANDYFASKRRQLRFTERRKPRNGP